MNLLLITIAMNINSKKAIKLQQMMNYKKWN